MKKLILAALTISGAASGLAAISPAAAAADQAVVDRYNKTCVVCHASGVANAPKTGVAEDWKTHLAKGNDALIKSVKNGLNAMPPRGMCNDCSDADYKALIEYMSTAKK
jgi:cytochrome c5